MGLSQVLQLLQNKAHPSQRGGVPIMKTFRREATGVEDINPGFAAPVMDDAQPVYQETALQPPVPRVMRPAPVLDATASSELLRQAQAILAGLGNDPRPQIQAPNNESIALALLPALLGAGTGYIGKLGQGYMAGQNQELARIEEERRRREQNVLRQAGGLQKQAGDMATRENLLFGQANQNYRNEQDNARMLTNTETVQNALNERFGMGDQTKRDIEGGRREDKAAQLELDREKVEVGNAAKLWAIALKDANMDGEVTAADVARLEAIRNEIGGEKYAPRLIIPAVGSSWAKIKAGADNVYRTLVQKERERHNGVMEDQGQARIDKPPASRGGGGSGGSGGGNMGKSASQLTGLIQGLQAKINGEKEGQRISGDQKKRSLAEIRIRKMAATRDSYIKDLANLGKLSRPLGEIPEVAATARSKNDTVNPMLLQDMQFGGFKPTISTANSGHSENTKAGYPSRHKQNNAVDISHINGIPVGTPAGRKLADEYVRMLVARGYTRNRESGNDMAVLWQMDGHHDHIHVSRNSKGNGGGIKKENSYAEGGDKTQTQVSPPPGKPKVKDGTTPSGKPFKFK